MPYKSAEKAREYNRNYFLAHKERVLKLNKEWQKRNIEKVRESYRRYGRMHKEERNTYRKVWRTRKRLENPEQTLLWRMRWKYKKMKNYSDELILKLIKSKCEICGTNSNVGIDHDHEKNIIRGALCQPCNASLGLLKDDVDLLNRAIEYLNKSNVPATSKDPSSS